MQQALVENLDTKCPTV